MKARSAARELALLAFSQLSKEITKEHNIDLEDIITMSVRTLVSEAENSLKDSLSSFMAMKEKIEEYEIDHEKNLEGPVDSGIVPVPIALTSDVLGKIDEAIDGLDKALSSLELSEFTAYSNKKETRGFAINLVNTFINHKQEVDAQIQKSAIGWNVDRLVRIDRDISRIAIVELLYFDDIPVSVSIDEAVELAKKYSDEESSSFINGILRGVVESNNLLTVKKN